MFAPKAFVRHHRPVRQRIVKRHSVDRALPIDYQPLTPGLRPKPDRGEVPGFHQPFICGDELYDDETDGQRR